MSFDRHERRAGCLYRSAGAAEAGVAGFTVRMSNCPSGTFIGCRDVRPLAYRQLPARRTAPARRLGR